MRVSLGTLVLLSLWLGVVPLVYVWRQPWVELSRVTQPRDPAKYFRHREINIGESPSRARRVITHGKLDSLRIYEGSRNIASIPIIGLTPISKPKFTDEFVFVCNVLAPNHTAEITYGRRFQEAWWGHFYRAEVWVLIGLSLFLLARAIGARHRTA